MTLLSTPHDRGELNDRLRNAEIVTPDLMANIVSKACLRLPPIRRTGTTARVERLIESGAWIDAALALIDLELPQWQVRRIAYDEGYWHCALSRARELPDWLDSSIEACHADLALAILSAFVEAQTVSQPASRPSVPAVSREASPIGMPLCCDNFA
jgi:hypothetical protein